MATLKTTRAEFESVWPSLVADLQDAAKKYNVPENALEWFTKVSAAEHYTTPFSRAAMLIRAVAPGKYAGREAEQRHFGAGHRHADPQATVDTRGASRSLHAGLVDR